MWNQIENPVFWYGCTKIRVKKEDTPVCEIETPEFWYGRTKILVKKTHTPLCQFENPEFLFGCTKIRVKKKHNPVCEKKTSKFFQNKLQNFFFLSNFFFKNPEFWYGCAKIREKKENTLYLNIWLGLGVAASRELSKLGFNFSLPRKSEF